MPRSFTHFHPAVPVTAGLFCIVLAQVLPTLPALLLSLLSCLALCRESAGTLWRMLRRTRWIMLSVVVLFAWQTPGSLLVPEWQAWSPTREGLLRALVQCLRLCAVLALVGLLMRRLSHEAWVAALHVLCTPLSRVFGFSRERAALRLWLILEEMGEQRARRVSGWRTFLQEIELAQEENGRKLQLSGLRSGDRRALGLLWSLAAGGLAWHVLH